MNQIQRQILQWIEANPMASQQQIAQSLGLSASVVAAAVSDLTAQGYIAGKGYVLRSGSYAVVVGGVNMDIGGHSFAPIVASDSNPGAIHMSLGGVGRNIAHNLRLMGVDVHLLTAYGDDLYGQRIAAACSELGIDVSRARVVPGAQTSTYLYIAEPDGDMAVALSDMQVCDAITPEYLASNLPLLQNAQVVVADTNIPVQSLRYLAAHCTAPLFCDPVSTVKAEKLLPVLNRIHTLKPNRIEAELLSGVPIRTRADAAEAAKVLLGKGVRRLFISMGADGVFAATNTQQLFLPNLPGTLVNTTGCGDAFLAALVWAYLEGTDLEATARAGLAAASIAMESEQTINPAMCADALRLRAGL